MATDLDRLVVQLSADIRKFEKSFAKAQGISNKTFNSIERRAKKFDNSLSRIGGGLQRSLVRTGAILGTAFSVREIKNYADAWTTAGNKIRASAQVAGRASRTLEGIIDIANESRTGLTETSDLYSKLLRATKDVAKSELDVARATLIVNKAFKAGGAALSEQRAGILQLSQALGSGLLQGDELRSVRENAPLLAQALAKEFGTTIAGLKKLGADGELAIDRVFQAILNAQPEIEAAFAVTNATIQDSFTRLNNAFVQYIGQADSANGASAQLVAGLTSLADNFERNADVALKFAGIIAAGLLGRSLTRMIQGLALGSAELFVFGKAITFAAAGTRGALVTSALGAGIGGPIAAAVGIGAAALAAYVLITEEAGDSNVVAARKAQLYAEALKEIERAAEDAGEAVESAAERFVAAETLVLKKSVASIRKEIETIKDELRDLLTEALGGSFGADQGQLGGLLLTETQKAVIKLKDGIGDANFDANKFLETLSQIGFQRSEFEEAALGAQTLVDKFQALILAVEKAITRMATLGRVARDLSDIDIELADKAIRRGVNESRDRVDRFVQDRTDDSKATQAEQRIEKRTEQILKAFEKLEKAANEAGLSLGPFTEEMARAQAVIELANIATVKNTQAQLDAAKNLIQQFEGGAQLRAFEDTDERGRSSGVFRIGFSSDTITTLDRAGNEVVQRVTAGMVTTLADASRDLDRRIREGRAENAALIGQDRFDALNADQQAVLSSLEFNFGKLPDRIVKALIEGDAGDVAAAIRASVSPGSILQGRRDKEAEIFLGNASIEIQLREQRLQIVTDTIEKIAEQNEMIRLETGLIGESNAAQEAAILRQQTINDLKAAGIPITAEVIAQIDREVSARFNLVEAYDAAAEAHANFVQVQQQIAGAFQSALSGFIQDLVAGKDATEALGNALARLAQRLLDIALNQIFASLFGGLGGGLFGGGGGIGRFAGGGQPRRLQHGGMIRGPGGPRSDDVPVLASNREFIVNARATEANRGLLEAINSGKVKSFADGGFIGSRKPGGTNATQGSFTQAAPIVSTQVINRFDSASFLSEALSTPEGSRVILNDVSARPDAYRSALGL